jgi:hypothetical protein
MGGGGGGGGGLLYISVPFPSAALFSAQPSPLPLLALKKIPESGWIFCGILDDQPPLFQN